MPNIILGRRIKAFFSNPNKRHKLNRIYNRRMKKIVLLVGMVGLLSSLIALRVLWLPFGPSTDQVTKQIQIASNTSTTQIAEQLYQEGLIRNQTAFLLYLRFSGYARQLKAGNYSLSNSMSVQEIAERIYRGENTSIYTRVTLPEGYTLDQIEETLAEKGLVDSEKFRAVLENGEFNYDFLEGLPSDKNRLEGFLFPATYDITSGMTEAECVDMMLKCFGRNVTPAIRQQAADQGLSVLELITMASIVEREARLEEERPIIAGVIDNRLKIGMLLQVDATVQYALGQHKEKIYYQDLELDSPYNTYIYPGLPPGPIASPGISSISAVLNPTRHDYYYYVAQSDGSHVFSKSLKEHNQAKSRIGNK